MSEEVKKDSIYNVMKLIYKVLKKQGLITDLFLERTIHFDPSTKDYAQKLPEEEKLVFYMLMLMYKMVFGEAGNYYKFKENDPKKFEFLNNKRPFYQSINRVDLTKAYIFEQAMAEAKEMSFEDLKEATGVLIDPKELGKVVRGDIVRRIKEV